MTGLPTAGHRRAEWPLWQECQLLRTCQRPVREGADSTFPCLESHAWNPTLRNILELGKPSHG